MPHSLLRYLDDGVVIPRLSAKTRKQALSELSHAMARKLDRDGQDIFDAIQERERLGSTAVGHGVVIPHAQIDGLDRTVGGFARLELPLDFEAIDDRPCDLVFMLLAPFGEGADHLRALARVSRVFLQADIRDRLREARTEEAILNVLATDLRYDAA